MVDGTVYANGQITLLLTFLISGYSGYFIFIKCVNNVD